MNTDFKKSCQKWHSKIIKSSKLIEVRQIFIYINKQIKDWMKVEKELNLKIISLEKELLNLKQLKAKAYFKIKMLKDLRQTSISQEKSL